MFDELDKAHLEVLKVFMSILDEGRCTARRTGEDGGRELDFRRCVFGVVFQQENLRFLFLNGQFNLLDIAACFAKKRSKPSGNRKKNGKKIKIFSKAMN